MDDFLKAPSFPADDPLVLARSLDGKRGVAIDGQTLIDDFFKTAAVLSSKMRSRRTRAMRASAKRIGLSVPEIIEVPARANWLDTGKKLREVWFARVGKRCNCWWCSVYQHTERGQREREWVNAVALATLGDPSALVERLRPRRGLDRFDQIVLADLLEMAFSGEINSELYPANRPKKIAARSCASSALKFYADWKTINRRHGIRDWGHSEDMKNFACDAVIEMHRLRRRDSLVSDHPLNSVPSLDEVRTLMDRPSKRRQ